MAAGASAHSWLLLALGWVWWEACSAKPSIGCDSKDGIAQAKRTSTRGIGKRKVHPQNCKPEVLTASLVLVCSQHLELCIRENFSG